MPIPSRGKLLLCLLWIGSGATLWWSYGDVRAALRERPAIEVRGALMAAGPAVPTATVRGEGEAAKAEPLVRESADGSLAVDLRALAFPSYDAPELRATRKSALPRDAFPEIVRGLHGKRIVASGYALPLDTQGTAVTRFLLTRFPPGCCFGAMPVADEWIEVTLAEPRTEAFTGFERVTVAGPLDVGEQLDDQGYLLSLYRMRGDSVEPAP